MNDYDKSKILRVLGDASGHPVTDVSHCTRHQLTATISVGDIGLAVIARVQDGIVQVWALRRWNMISSASTSALWKILALDLAQEIEEHAKVARYN